MSFRSRTAASLAVLALSAAALTLGTGSAGAASANSAVPATNACGPYSTEDNSSAVVQIVAGGALAHNGPAAACTATANMVPKAKLNAWCGVYNIYGNHWVYVGSNKWIYAGDLVLVSGSLHTC